MTDPAHFLFRSTVALTVSLSLVLPGAASAQVQAVQGAASAPARPASGPNERAMRDADRPLYWIRLLADKGPTAPKAPAKAAAPAPAAAAAPARPVVVASATVERAAPPAAGPARTPSPPIVQAAPVTPPAAEPQPTATPVAASPSPVDAASPAPAPATATVAAAPPADNPALTQPAGQPAGLDIGAGGALGVPGGPAVDAAPADADGDAGLVMTRSVDPDFGPSRIRLLRKGSVEVQFEVGADGHVSQVSVLRSSHRSLEAPAIDAVRQWEFKPNGRTRVAAVELAFDIDKFDAAAR